MRILVVLVLLGAVLVARPPLAEACKCTHPSLSSKVRKADTVFVGEIVAITRAGKVDRLEVRRTAIWKGATTTTVVVESTATSCGVITGGAKVGKSWLFVGTLSTSGVLSVRQCNGSRQATRGVRAQLVKLLGEPLAPS